MRFQIDHLTRYQYSVPVELGEHLLRFHPRQDAGQQVLDVRVDVDPLPLRREWIGDEWGNAVERVWFDGATNRLTVDAHLRVETRPGPGASRVSTSPVPPRYDEFTAGIAACLAPYPDDGSLESFVRPLLAGADGSAAVFLDRLNQSVHALYRGEVRVDGPPRSPTETLARREGVCRDLALLFMAASRHAGIAARFVSGYQQGRGGQVERHLHAWPEVYLPDAGWLGFDPTSGTRVGEQHVAIAAAPTPAEVTPVEGGFIFSGPTVTSTLDTEIRIQAG